jgi:heat shock protein HspQ
LARAGGLAYGYSAMKTSKFGVGQVVQHKQLHYRGVVVDVDAEFSLTEEWYESVARTRPPKDQPWYRVLVDGTTHETYVAEYQLQADPERRGIEHPDLHRYFSRMEGGQYVRNTLLN